MQKKIKSMLVIGFFLSSGMFMSFQDAKQPLTVQQLIDKEVANRVEKYRVVRMKKCQEKILRIAGERADSIIIARAKAMKVLQDTLTRPIAPDRPTRPELLEPIDSTAPAPLLDSLNQG